MEVKLETLWHFVTKNNIDIFGFTKASKCWDLVPDTQQLPMKTHGWWENSHWSLSHNQTEANAGMQQPGGAGLLCVNQVTHQTMCPGDDPSGLGYWSRIRIRGPGGFFLWVVAMYQPCFSTGPLTMYQQHIHRLTALNQTECPREAILIDIAKQIQKWQDDGDQVLLLTDYNDNILSTLVCVWASKLGLVKAVTWLNTTDAPPTFQRGSRPIDGIFAAPQLLERAAGGYFGFGEAVPSNHWAIWVDFGMPQVCPHNQEAFCSTISMTVAMQRSPSNHSI